MTIGSPSGSGATQNDIANGADESDGRWQTHFDGSLAVSQPPQVEAITSGASLFFATEGASISSGTAGDTGEMRIGGQQVGGTTIANGTVLIKARYGSTADTGTLSDIHNVGQFSNDTADGIAVFRPHIGNNTDGNVLVDNDGTNTTGSVTYPNLTNVQTLAVLIDRAGNYLSSGNTGFYINSDPRRGGSPDADLAAVPDTGAFSNFGVYYESNGSDQNLVLRHLEVAVRQ